MLALLVVAGSVDELGTGGTEELIGGTELEGIDEL